MQDAGGERLNASSLGAILWSQPEKLQSQKNAKNLGCGGTGQGLGHVSRTKVHRATHLSRA